MHEISAIDIGKTIDWGKTSQDYAQYRPGPPPRFYATLQAFGIGLSGQTILDLGTGTGLLNLTVDFYTGPAEEVPCEDGSFEVITANQCWLYFDKAKMIPEVKRLLKPSGLLVTSHFSWLPRLDPVAKATEELVLKHNPAWSANDWSGNIPMIPSWSEEHFQVQGMFWFDAPIGFTHESWRGRIRACRGVGAGLEGDAVAAFDAEHQALLEKMVPNEFSVLHRIDAHLFGVE